MRFCPGLNVGVDVSADEIRRTHDAMLLAGGAGWPFDLKIPGRDLKGIHFAMDYLTQQTACAKVRQSPRISSSRGPAGCRHHCG